MSSSKTMIRILLGDDHAIVRDGLRWATSTAPDIVVGEATNGTEVLAMVKKIDFDLLLLDLDMPDPSGLELIQKLLAFDAALKILIFSMHEEPHLVTRMLQAGACGYITKNGNSAMLVAAIRKIVAGGHFIDPVLVDDMLFSNGGKINHDIPSLEMLTDREFQVLKMLTEGRTPKDIAESLNLSVKTISGHKTNMMRKLGVRTTAGLLHYATQCGAAKG